MTLVGDKHDDVGGDVGMVLRRINVMNANKIMLSDSSHTINTLAGLYIIVGILAQIRNSAKKTHAQKTTDSDINTTYPLASRLARLPTWRHADKRNIPCAHSNTQHIHPQPINVTNYTVNCGKTCKTKYSTYTHTDTHQSQYLVDLL